ncbi:hypothetical protein ACQY0O_004171 [Thecaphora frezii]
MSFSWKGLLGVNLSSQNASHSASTSSSSSASQPTAASSTNPHASAASSPVATKAAANGFGATHNGGASMVGVYGSALAAAIPTTPSTKPAANANAHSLNHHPTPQISFFGNIVPPGPSSSLSSSGGSSLAQQKRPLEIPVNSIEGGGPLLGMENFGNTCYVNSMLQALYFCRPFRESLLSYQPISCSSSDGLQALPEAEEAGHEAYGSPSDPETDSLVVQGIPPPDTLFAALRDLFDIIAQSPKSREAAQGASALTPTTSTFSNGMPASSGSPTPLVSAAGSGGGSGAGVTRKASSLGRPATAGASSASGGRGGLGNHPATSGSHATANANGGASVANSVAMAMAIATGSNSVAGQAPPSLSISTATANNRGSCGNGFSVDSAAVKAFIGTLKRENVLFDSTMHQDAHEMLNFVLNKVGEDLIDADRARRAGNKKQHPQHSQQPQQLRASVREVGPDGSTCVHRLFAGVLTNETRCLTCETVTSRDEAFLDLSIDIEQNSSVTSCLRQFSASEMLRSRNKFFCDSCSGLQEAEKRMKIRKLPNVLALHLKRFKYEESVQRYVKLAYRVAFPLELRLFNTSDDADDPDRLYELFAIVVHIGAGPHHGHYIAIVKVGERWVVFDDDNVSYIDESEISKYYGDRPGIGSAYVLFYQAVDLDFEGLGLQRPTASCSAGADGHPTANSAPLVHGDDAQAPLREGSSYGGLSTVHEGYGGVAIPGAGHHAKLGSAPGLSSSAVSHYVANSGSGWPTNVSESGGGATAASDAAGNGGSSGGGGGGGGGGWFGSLRNRSVRSGSQSLRRPKTASAVEVFGTNSNGSTAASPGSNGDGSMAASTARRTATPAEAATPETMTASTGTLSSVATPAEPPMSTWQESALAVQVDQSLSTASGPSPDANEGVVYRNNAPAPATASPASAAVRQAQARAEEQRLQREENMIRAQMNRDRRVRAASESMVSPSATVVAPIVASPIDDGDSTGLTSVPLMEEPALLEEHLAGAVGGELSRASHRQGGAEAAATAAAHGADSPSRRMSQPQLLAAGAAFAPADRPFTKKEQKAIARTSRRGSSGLGLGSMSIPGFGGGSALVHAATVGDLSSGSTLSPSKSTGKFSNFFGGGGGGGNSLGGGGVLPLPNSLGPALGSGGGGSGEGRDATPDEAPTPSSMSSSIVGGNGSVSERGQATRKSSISTRSLSRTFGFGRSNKT